MADFNAKTATPDTSVDEANGGLIGADSQAAPTPSWFSFATIKAWIQSFASGHGQCRLEYVSATQLILKPVGGNKLRITGVSREVPSAGVTVANTSLANSTAYNVYAYMNGATMTLELSTTARAVDTTAGNVGVQIKSGDASRTLVGKIETNASGQFVAGLTLSWFSRKLRRNEVIDGTDRTATTIWTEANSSSGRVRFGSWGAEEDNVAVSYKAGIKHPTAGQLMFVGVGLDGTSAVVGGMLAAEPVANYTVPVANRYSTLVTEGFHYYTLVGGVTSGTMTFDNSNSGSAVAVEFLG